jgi:hypothetical protein
MKPKKWADIKAAHMTEERMEKIRKEVLAESAEIARNIVRGYKDRVKRAAELTPEEQCATREAVADMEELALAVAEMLEMHAVGPK